MYEPRLRMRRRLGRKMLAAAESHFEPEIAGRTAEQPRGIEPPAPRQNNTRLRQQFGEGAPAPRPEGPAATPSVERPARTLRRCSAGNQVSAALSGSTRSVRSQEKPPSGSGARPKWP